MTIHYPEQLILVAGVADSVVERQQLSRAVTRGELVRIKRGAYVDAAAWGATLPEARHRTKVIAFAHSHPGAVFSHHSAAVLLGLHLVGAIPSRVQVIAQRASGGRSEPGLQRRCVGFMEEEVIQLALDTGETVRCTSPTRTLMDLADVQAFRYAVVPIDHALRLGLSSAIALSDLADRRGRFRGERRIRRVLAFGDARAQFPGESLSRAVIHELGFPAPELQVEHPAPNGSHYFTDFEWPAHRVIGEFDGKGKYLKDEYLGDRSPGEAVHEEKVREDWLRDEGNAVKRWGWDDARTRMPLRVKLLAAGLPLVRPPVRVNPARSRGRW